MVPRNQPRAISVLSAYMNFPAFDKSKTFLDHIQSSVCTLVAKPTSTSNDDWCGTEDIVAMGRRNVELSIACSFVLQGYEAH